MASSQIQLTREQLQAFLPNLRTITVFEEMMKSTGTGLPDAIAEVNAALAAHTVATAAHGAIGDVVGTTNIQTLTNKTLNSPVLISPDLGTPTVLVGTNITGTAAGLSIGGNAATVTTNANLTGPITSVGNATSIASQTGTGMKFVVDTSPVLVTPNIGDATGTSLSVTGQLTSTLAVGTPPLVVTSTTNVPNLNASSLNGATFASPGAIGGTTPSTGQFTTLTIAAPDNVSAAVPTVASAAVIAITTPIAFVSGVAAINTITAPAGLTNGGQITVIPTGLFTTTAAGNIALASTAVVSKALIMTYVASTAKWYPSY